jgi:D-sedoheptulose 7-phosphate isomerase
METVLPKLVADACRTFQSLVAQQTAFERIAVAAIRALKSGGKILTCGNGGSAADALHLAEELVGRYNRHRRSLPAICLNADPTLLTCIGNDFGFDEVFARQIEGLGGKNDLLVCFTTSGNSANVLRALAAAKTKGIMAAVLLGKDGGKAKGKADMELIVDNTDTARVQEAHTLILHALLETIEQELVAVGENPPAASRAPAPIKSRPPSQVMHRVLIVEDDYELADLLVEVLTLENCAPDRAANGVEALDRLRTSPYDAIICDLMMPLMDGETLYREVAKQFPHLADHFLFVTSQAAQRGGFTDFIVRTGNTLLGKPFEVDQLRAALKEVFRR